MSTITNLEQQVAQFGQMLQIYQQKFGALDAQAPIEGQEVAA
jgi:hypothetical protein